jgi:hypothetical protein
MVRNLLVVAFRRFWQVAPRWSWLGHLVGSIQTYLLHEVLPVKSNG